MLKLGINCGSRPVLTITGVKVQLQDAPAPQALPYAGERAGDGGAEYRFGADGVEVRLILKYLDDVTLGWIEASIAQEGEGFHRQRAFTATSAVTVEFADSDQLTGLVAHYLHKDWWTRPAFGTSFASLPPRVQSLLWQAGNEYFYLLPVVDAVRAEAQGIPSGLSLVLSPGASGFNSMTSLAFAVGRGPDPYALVQNTAAAALQELSHSARPRWQKTYPPILEYLGWCSWDAFYKDVNQAGLKAKAQELQEKGVPVKWFMIDDGWLDVKDGKLWSFHADQEKFPGGLGETARELKEDYGIQWVGVWHTAAGYWNGVHPEGELPKTHRQYLYKTRRGSLLPHPEMERGFAFWYSWHRQLLEWGIDFVKVDGQSAVFNFFGGELPIAEVCRAIHAGLEASVGMNFGLNMINCMGMAADNLWTRPASALSRSSDDSVPSGQIPFREHALQNAYNSLYHAQFYWGDWDMFWSDHPEWKQSAVLRALSGGPIYISDPVGKTRPEVIRPLVLRDGRILRLDQPGLPAADCLFKNPHTDQIPLKIWGTIKGQMLGDAGVVGLFNLDEEGRTVTGIISPGDVPTLVGREFIVFNHFGQKAQVLTRDEKLELTLAGGQVELFVLVPQDRPITPLGLVDKYLSPAAICRCAAGSQGAEVVLKDGGLFGFAAEKEPREVLINGTAAKWEPRDGYFVVDCSGFSGPCVVSIRL